MKKKLIGIFVCMLLFVPVLSVTATADDDHPDVWFSSIKSGRGITVKIKNFGDETYTNIEWGIWLKGECIFRGSETTGKIETLNPGQEVTIRAKVFGFGRHIFRALSSIYRDNLDRLQTHLLVNLFQEGEFIGAIQVGAPLVIGGFIMFYPYSYGDA